MSDEAPKQPPSVYEHIALLLDQIASVSWQKLGLQPDIMTGKIEQNLPEAKVALDLAGYLAGVLEPQLDPDDQRKVKNLVHDLRLNYLHKSKEATD
ncbi:MAG TPA: DUF1844 domain-containing protein [Fimbriimonas sp.]|nr:DUF1844 domain-containing protein [Fimbriimonas sp.]